MHIARCHQRHARDPRSLPYSPEQHLFPGMKQPFDSGPAAVGEQRPDPAHVLTQGTIRLIPARNQHDQAIGQAGEMRRIRAACKIGAGDVVGSFRASLPGQRDQFAQIAVAFPVDGETHQPQSILQHEFAADHKMQSPFSGFSMRSYHSCHGAFIRTGEGAVTQGYGTFHQLFRQGSAFEEAEAGAAVKLGVTWS